MSIKLGDEAPDFTVQTTEGTINFHQWLGSSWGLLFSHPKDYTPALKISILRLSFIFISPYSI